MMKTRLNPVNAPRVFFCFILMMTSLVNCFVTDVIPIQSGDGGLDTHEGDPNDLSIQDWHLVTTLRTTSTAPHVFQGEVIVVGRPVRWDFGEGAIIEGSMAQHRYSSPGEKSVKIFVETTDLLSGLAIVTLSNAALIGPIPSAFFQIALQNLDLSDNQLSSVIPREISRATSMRTLFLNKNRLSGSIPAELGNKPRLISINLDSNLLSGSEAGAFSGLPELKLLHLELNQLPTPAIDRLVSDIHSERALFQSINQFVDLSGTNAAPSAAALSQIHELSQPGAFTDGWRFLCDGC